MPKKIFISYRRDDASAEARQLQNYLQRAGGKETTVTLDITSFRIGKRFDRQLDKTLADCNIFIALIGPKWLKILKDRAEKHERSTNTGLLRYLAGLPTKRHEQDYVRLEVAAALNRNIESIIPITVGGATLPTENELPGDIRRLAKFQGREIRHTSANTDYAALCSTLGFKPPEVRKNERKLLRRGLIAGGAIGAFVCAAALSFYYKLPLINMGREIYNKITSPTPGDGDKAPVREAKCERNCTIPEMVSIPAGTFVIGSSAPTTKDKAGALLPFFGRSTPPEDEWNQQERKIGSIRMSKHEVTFAQWDECVRNGGCRQNQAPGDAGWGRGNRPVINVSWHDANTYADWLSKHLNARYRLPTEAEWEYAARAGTITRYAFGDSLSSPQARFGGSTQGTTPMTMEVGSYPSNKFGLHDMHGNVSEWVSDCYQASYAESPPTKPSECKLHVHRGGAWQDGAEKLRSAARGKKAPDTRDSTTGFRLVEELRR